LRIKYLLSKYDKAVQVDKSLPIKKRTLIVSQQLKSVRDDLCKNSKTLNDVLEAQYAYIISSLNHRNRIWKYDYMSFPRRVGELWESFCKAAFYNAQDVRHINPPAFSDIKKEIKKSIPKEIWNIVGEVNLKTDSLFYTDRKLHVIDLKSSFNSHEKGNMQRLRTVGAVYKLWKPRTKLLVLVRETDNSNYLEHLEEFWEVKCGKDAYKTIENFTGVNLRKWIDRNVNFEKHLDRNFFLDLKKNDLESYLNW
jgi:hypothetical protein